jgi:hypothetical protein
VARRDTSAAVSRLNALEALVLMKISLVVSCGAIAGDVGRRPDDWPVMQVSDAGFPLQLVGFFNANPALDVPPAAPHANGHIVAADI